VATDFWSAKLGRDALKIEWDPGSGASLDTTQLLAGYREKAKTKGNVAVEKGDADAALEKGKKRVVAEYDVPYLAHAPMEPLNATVKLEGDRCEIWAGTQFQTMDQMVASKIAGIAPQNVTIHTCSSAAGSGAAPIRPPTSSQRPSR